VTVPLPAGVRCVEPRDAAIRCSGTSGTVVCAVGRTPASFAFPLRAARPGRAAPEAEAESNATDPRPEGNVARVTLTIHALALRRLRTIPATPRAGRRFRAAATLVRPDTGAAARARSVSCPGAVARSAVASGTAFRGRGTVGRTGVSCSWTLPAGSRGRFFRGALVARRNGDLRPKLSFSRRIAA
jgi:hypothetical protein